MDFFQSRRLVLQGVFIAVVLIYVGRLFHLQVIESEYKQLANNFSLRRLPVYPARGLVYDRNDKLILYNKAEYDLMVVPLQTRAFDTLELATLLEWDKETVVQTLKKAWKASPYRPFTFVKGIQADQFVTLREAMYQFPGFYAQVRTVRSYPFAAGAHLLGYIGEVSPKQIEKNRYYRQGDYIGITGLEEYYENTLRGQKGVRYMLVDVNNREQGRFNEGKYDTLALPGRNLYSSLDIDLQKYGEELMQDKIGSVVAIDPSTGEVIAMISSPTYDPGLLSGKDRGKQFSRLYADSLKPLFNRATKAPYPPGSTFKPMMAAIGMQEGIINPDAPFFQCSGTYFVGNRRIGCHYSSYPTNVQSAISHSCNGYFAHYFMAMVNNTAKYGNVKKGLDTWVAYLKRAGIGVKTGIDIPNEGYGFAPDSKLYDKWYKGQWRGATIVS
ncbi:MAG TPA: penicillin-binding transpeptidase domain-containing protein, partial [Chitinophagales bacterium]|nr:penicillin-binding transpeptidase domain-containing protein [Chitinophagales bacterium]